jgi:hypothetical protein
VGRSACRGVARNVGPRCVPVVSSPRGALLRRARRAGPRVVTTLLRGHRRGRRRLRGGRGLRGLRRGLLGLLRRGGLERSCRTRRKELRRLRELARDRRIERCGRDERRAQRIELAERKAPGKVFLLPRVRPQRLGARAFRASLRRETDRVGEGRRSRREGSECRLVRRRRSDLLGRPRSGLHHRFARLRSAATELVRREPRRRSRRVVRGDGVGSSEGSSGWRAGGGGTSSNRIDRGGRFLRNTRRRRADWICRNPGFAGFPARHPLAADRFAISPIEERP